MPISPIRQLAICAAIAAPAFASAADVAPAPAASPYGGPVVPGVCLLSREAVLANSKAGIAAQARLQQLATEAQAEVDADRQPIATEAAALKAAAGKQSAESLKPRQQALVDKINALQAKADQRKRELDATRTRAFDLVLAAAQPGIVAAYKAHGCGLLFDRNVALVGNFANDLTADAVKALDATTPSVSFDRVNLTATPAKP